MDNQTVEQLSDSELTRWLLVFEHMTHMEARIAELEAGLIRGRRLPYKRLLEYQDWLQMELKRREQREGNMGNEYGTS